jgi:hypothetical protein
MRKMVRPERFELPAFWFVGFGLKNLSALSSVACGQNRSETYP